jgi:hypothetical protein
MARRTMFRVIEAQIIDDDDGPLGDALAGLLEEGGLTRSQAEQVRAELEKAGFARFCRLPGRARLGDLSEETIDRLLLEAQDRVERPQVKQAHETCLYLRKAWRTDLSGGVEGTRS